MSSLISCPLLTCPISKSTCQLPPVYWCFRFSTGTQITDNYPCILERARRLQPTFSAAAKPSRVGCGHQAGSDDQPKTSEATGGIKGGTIIVVDEIMICYFPVGV